MAQLGDGQRAAVAHGGADLGQGGGHAVAQSTGVGHVGVHALFKGELGGAAQIVALPVAGTGAALAPVLLHVAAADEYLAGGGLVEPGEVPAQHAEVGAHGQSQGDVVVLDDAAVGTDGHVHAGLFKVLVPLGSHVDDGGGLAAADALGLAGDADGAAADADLDEVGARVRQEAEALAVHHVAGAHLHSVTVVLADPLEGAQLPLGVALGGVDDQHIHAGLHQSGYSLGVVTGVDTGAHHVALLGVQQLQGVALVGVIVLAEHEAHQMAVVGDDGQGVELVVPDDVVGHLQAGALGGEDELFHRGHELADGGGGIHAADTVVPAGDQAQQLAGAGAVVGDGHGGVAGALLESQHIGQRVAHTQVGVTGDEAGLVVFHLADHFGLLGNGLGDIDEGDAALTGQTNAHFFTGHGLHDGRNHGHVHGQGALLALLELDHRRLEGDVGGDALGGRVAGHQQVFTESMGRFTEIICHEATSFRNIGTMLPHFCGKAT